MPNPTTRHRTDLWPALRRPLQEKAIASYEVDELYAFFLDEGVPPEFSVYDELDLLFTQ